MRLQPAIPFYVPRETPLHHLHVTGKLLLFLLYAIIIFMATTWQTAATFLAMLAGFTCLLRLPLRSKPALVLAFVLLAAAALTHENLIFGLALAVGKILSLVLLLGLFSMTTRVSVILQTLLPSGALGAFVRAVVYIINTTLAVFPSLQYDLQRVIDAETLRRGVKVSFYSIGSWMSILTVVFVRVMLRAERFTDTVVDRGFIPSQGLQPLLQQSFGSRDLILTAGFAALGLLIRIGLG